VLRDLPRPGKPLAYSSEVRARLIAKVCTRPPYTRTVSAASAGPMRSSSCERVPDAVCDQLGLEAVDEGLALALSNSSASSDGRRKAPGNVS
jgi:hypothetical protein